jgi:hypothetical protein
MSCFFRTTFDKEKASLSKGGGTAPCAVTEDSLHRAVLYYRGMFGKIGANKSSVTPHSGATAPLLKEPSLRQHHILPSSKDKR